MRSLLCGLLCLVTFGCSDSNRADRDADSVPGSRIPVTTKRPVTDPADGTTSSTDRTNTGVNVRDRDDATKTPLDQNENKTDIDISANIRQQIVATDMSIKAHNVKIITQDRKVTLRGPVATEQEKQRIEEIAKNMAGANNVDNQLDVTNE